MHMLNNRARLFASSAVLLLVSCVYGAAPAGATSVKLFRATISEDFSFHGCPNGVDPASVDLCGTATVPGIGTATVGTVITTFDPLPSGCFHDEHTTTLSFATSTLVVAISGTLCPTNGSNIFFVGTYGVAGGTGEFAHASGAGIDIAVRQDGPVVSRLVGVLRP